MCERAVDRQPPVAGTEPATPQRRQSLSQSEGQLRCLPQPEQLQGLRARTEQGREWMMAQNEVVVVGIDVAKDKVDACIRAFKLRQTWPSTAQGHRKLVAWLRKHQVNKAVMEASGGYERAWARVLREAGIEVRIVDPKRVRSFALSAGRLAKNDAIDAEMIAWFAETFSEAPSQPHDAAREELRALVKARLDLIDFRMRLVSQSEHAAPGLVQKAHAHILKSLASEIAKLEAAICAKIKSLPDFAERAEASPTSRVAAAGSVTPSTCPVLAQPR